MEEVSGKTFQGLITDIERLKQMVQIEQMVNDVDQMRAEVKECLKQKEEISNYIISFENNHDNKHLYLSKHYAGATSNRDETGRKATALLNDYFNQSLDNNLASNLLNYKIFETYSCINMISSGRERVLQPINRTIAMNDARKLFAENPSKSVYNTFLEKQDKLRVNSRADNSFYQAIYDGNCRVYYENTKDGLTDIYNTLLKQHGQAAKNNPYVQGLKDCITKLDKEKQVLDAIVAEPRTTPKLGKR